MNLFDLQNSRLLFDAYQFEQLCIETFLFQQQHNSVYNQYLKYLKTDITKIKHIEQIPFLPIEFFKTHHVKTGVFNEETVFESSSTTGIGVSKHFVNSTQSYINSFISSFNFFYQDYSEYCHLALLPSYLERQNSSLVFQINHFIQNSKIEGSGFYKDNHQALFEQLKANEFNKTPTILWGVTYALLDFADQYPFSLKHTQIIETGGMKGKRKELTRNEVHEHLKKAFEISDIASEYGMTELFSQAYAIKNGVFQCPSQMKVIGREINDPFHLGQINKNVALNIIDLSNQDSCAFIATSDLGKVYQDGSFEVLGRIDYSDTRGCNLLIT
jgi:hypothetical protein